MKKCWQPHLADRCVSQETHLHTWTVYLNDMTLNKRWTPQKDSSSLQVHSQVRSIWKDDLKSHVSLLKYFRLLSLSEWSLCSCRQNRRIVVAKGVEQTSQAEAMKKLHWRHTHVLLVNQSEKRLELKRALLDFHLNRAVYFKIFQ